MRAQFRLLALLLVIVVIAACNQGGRALRLAMAPRARQLLRQPRKPQ